MSDLRKSLALHLGLLALLFALQFVLPAYHHGNLARIMVLASYAMGYNIILILVASAREILGSGQWFGFQVLPSAYVGNGLALLAPGAFIILGLLIWAKATVF